MSSLSHASPLVQPDDVEPFISPVDTRIELCPRGTCRLEHPADRSRWCLDCLCGYFPFGEGATPEPDAPGEPRLPMPDWIEVQAQLIRVTCDSNLGRWLAAKIDDLASECRLLDATTPDEFDGRAEAMARLIEDRDARDDHDRIFHGVGCL